MRHMNVKPSKGTILLRGLWVLLLSPAALAQSTPPETATSADPERVEVITKPVNQIPAEYRSGADKPRKPFTVRYTCPDSGRLYVVFDNAQQTATIESGNTTRYLKQGVSADGGRYVNSNESYVFWVKGKRATINGQETCDAD